MTDHAPENGEHLLGFVTRFEAGDAETRAAVFYELLAVATRLGETATAADQLIDESDAARTVAEDSLLATTKSFEDKLAAAAAENERLTAALQKARARLRSLQEELTFANLQIIHLRGANDEFAEEVESLTALVERGEIRPQHVIGFTLIGVLSGNTDVYARTAGAEKPRVTVRKAGMNLIVGPEVTPPTLKKTNKQK